MMWRRRVLSGLAVVAWAGLPAAAQNPPQNPPAAAPGGQRNPRAPAVQVMTLSTSGWTDGGQIPVKYSQAGEEVSPPLAWSAPPSGTVSLALVVHDLDAPLSGGADDVLHWLVWNIPATLTAFPEGVPQGPELPDGTRQISVTGPYYRGPAAPATGPVHHYLFELYALDTRLEVPPVGAAPAATRAAVMAALSGHVRAKGVLLGLFRRGSGLP